jgi:uncharacterized protein YjlB
MTSLVEPAILLFRPDTQVPNNTLPVLHYRQPLSGGGIESRIRQMFERHHWRGVWRNGIYDFHHFHSNAHEVLGIARGSVDVQLGGESGQLVTLNAGDIVVLPAGTGHRRISDGHGLVVMGGYPAGQEHCDLCRSKAERPDWEARIAAVAMPDRDPVFGEEGPLLRLWGATR